MVANYLGLDLIPHWYGGFETEKSNILTNQAIEENIAWKRVVTQNDLVEKFKGLVTDIDNDVVTVVFKNAELGTSEAYRFGIDKFDFSLKINDSVILNQYSNMKFEFIKYSENFYEKFEDKMIAKKIASYEEDYDI